MSASPAAAGTDSNDPKKITFRFCSECSNLLHPKEDKESHTLMYACKTCQYQMDAPSACVARTEMTNLVGDTAGITQDVAQDPTVGRPDFVSFEDDFPGFCTLCGQEIFCEVCGQEADGGMFVDDTTETSSDDANTIASDTSEGPIPSPMSCCFHEPFAASDLPQKHAHDAPATNHFIHHDSTAT